MAGLPAGPVVLGKMKEWLESSEFNKIDDPVPMHKKMLGTKNQNASKKDLAKALVNHSHDALLASGFSDNSLAVLHKRQVTAERLRVLFRMLGVDAPESKREMQASLEAAVSPLGDQFEQVQEGNDEDKEEDDKEGEEGDDEEGEEGGEEEEEEEEGDEEDEEEDEEEGREGGEEELEQLIDAPPAQAALPPAQAAPPPTQAAAPPAQAAPPPAQAASEENVLALMLEQVQLEQLNDATTAQAAAPPA